MKRLFVAVSLLALSGCANYAIISKCNDQNPLPTSMKVGSAFGLLGMSAAYGVDGDSISDVNARRDACYKASGLN